jgi:mevalonate kinase
MFSPFVSSSPGKVLLCGEHAVVHGARAIAVAIEQRTFAQFQPASADVLELCIDHPKLNKTYAWPLEQVREAAKSFSGAFTYPAAADASLAAELRTLPETEEASCFTFLFYYAAFVLSSRGDAPSVALRVLVRTQLPMGAGLGSSAAFCAALATGFLFLRLTLEQRAPPASINARHGLVAAPGAELA